LYTTGQPAARAETVSPPATEKAKGKIACAKYSDYAKRNLYLTDVGLGQRCTLWLCSINNGINPGTFFQQLSKEFQLINCALYFTFKAGPGQVGFMHGHFYQFLFDEAMPSAIFSKKDAFFPGDKWR
jgi:hypothetical protein